MKTFKDFVIEKKLTQAELDKREEIATAMEKDDPNIPMDKKMAIATSVAKRVAESEELDEAISSGKYVTHETPKVGGGTKTILIPHEAKKMYARRDDNWSKMMGTFVANRTDAHRKEHDTYKKAFVSAQRTITKNGWKHKEMNNESIELDEDSTKAKIDKHNAAVEKMKTSRSYAGINYKHPDLLKTAPKGYGFTTSHRITKLSESEELDEATCKIDYPGHKLHGKTATIFHRFEDGRVNVKVAHSQKKGDVSNYTLKPGQFKESVAEATSPFDWKNYKSTINWNDDAPKKSSEGGTIHKARETPRNAEGGELEKRGRGRPKGDYGSYKIDKATRDDPAYKAELSRKVMAAKADGFKARDEFKHAMHQEIMKKQLASAGLDPKDHEAAIAKKNPIKLNK